MTAASATVFELAARRHDHQACVGDALSRADRICAQRGVRLTALRRRVLELVWSSHKPRGAYDILRDLSTGERRPAPLTVYRALDFLLENGLVHRLESLNAYVGCPHPGRGHAIQFLVCTRCGAAQEIGDTAVARAIESAARAAGFSVERPTVEIAGTCATCAAGSKPSA